MTGGDEYAAQIVGVDADKDVAVLRLNLPDTVDREARPCDCHIPQTGPCCNALKAATAIHARSMND